MLFFLVFYVIAGHDRQSPCGLFLVTYICKKIVLCPNYSDNTVSSSCSNWDGEGFVMEYAHNIKANDLKRIERMIAENTDIIINRWYELFKTDNEDNQ